MFTREIKDLENYINQSLKYRSLNYCINVEILGDIVFVKNQHGEILFSGTPIKVYNQMHSFRRVIDRFPYK